MAELALPCAEDATLLWTQMLRYATPRQVSKGLERVWTMVCSICGAPGNRRTHDRHPDGPAGHGDAEPLYQLTTGIINADSTNRIGAMRGDNLVPEVNYIVNDILGNPSIFVVSELPGVKQGQAILEKTGSDGFAHKFTGHYDSLAVGVNGGDFSIAKDFFPKKDKGNYVLSHQGKYIATVLESKDQLKRVLAMGTHLPHKDKVKRASVVEWQNDFIEEAADTLEIDGIILFGDLNRQPKTLVKEYASLTPALKKAHGATTRSATTEGYRDNLLASDGIIVTHRSIFRDYQSTTHYPITIGIKLDV